MHSLLLVLAAAVSVRHCLGQVPCPCQDPSLCEPIKGSPKNEVFGFVTSQVNWPGYNWTLLTTVALFTDMNSSLLCHAHSFGVRVVLSASYNTSELGNYTNVQVSKPLDVPHVHIMYTYAYIYMYSIYVVRTHVGVPAARDIKWEEGLPIPAIIV